VAGSKQTNNGIFILKGIDLIPVVNEPRLTAPFGQEISMVS